MGAFIFVLALALAALPFLLLLLATFLFFRDKGIFNAARRISLLFSSVPFRCSSVTMVVAAAAGDDDDDDDDDDAW